MIAAESTVSFEASRNKQKQQQQQQHLFSIKEIPTKKAITLMHTFLNGRNR